MMNHKSKTRKQRQGFTLMEVLLVLMILVVLASMAVTIFGGTQEQALKDAAKGQIGVFKSAISISTSSTPASYPTDLKELVDKPSDSKVAERWRGPYLDRKSPSIPGTTSTRSPPPASTTPSRSTCGRWVPTARTAPPTTSATGNSVMTRAAARFHGCRSGLTLFEILLVLALLVVIAARDRCR